MSDVRLDALAAGLRVYGRMLDLDDAHIEDAVRGGIKVAVDHALAGRHLPDGEMGYWRECYRDQLARANDAEAEVERLKRLLDQRGRDAADAEDEAERLHRLMSEMASQQRAEVERLREALTEIRDADPVDMALDPNWSARIARAALSDIPALPEKR